MMLPNHLLKLDSVELRNKLSIFQNLLKHKIKQILKAHHQIILIRIKRNINCKVLKETVNYNKFQAKYKHQSSILNFLQTKTSSKLNQKQLIEKLRWMNISLIKSNSFLIFSKKLIKRKHKIKMNKQNKEDLIKKSTKKIHFQRSLQNQIIKISFYQKRSENIKINY